MAVEEVAIELDRPDREVGTPSEPLVCIVLEVTFPARGSIQAPR